MSNSPASDPLTRTANANQKIIILNLTIMIARKIIGITLFALSFAMDIATTVFLGVKGGNIELWLQLATFTLIMAALLVVTLRPDWNGQYTFNFKERKFEWRSKNKLTDTGNYRFLSNGAITFSLALLGFCHILADAYGTHFSQKMFYASAFAPLCALPVAIWCSIKMRKGTVK